MILARVVGTVVATRKDPRLVSNKLLVARPMDPHGKAEGNYLVAVDTVDAGVGETVLIVSGSSARMAAGMKDCPVDAAIVGIVDHVEVTQGSIDTMQIARVIGDVVTTMKDENLSGIKLLVLQPLDPDGNAAGRTLVAVDAVGAGVGETVFFVRGKEASFPFHPTEVPTDAGIVGIVDRHVERVRVRRTCRTEDGLADAARPRSRHGRGDAEAPGVHGAKLLLVQPVGLDDAPRGTALLAVDSVGAGVHEKVLIVMEGRAAGEALGRKGAPVDAAIIGIVDSVDVQE